jgi:hypothetical protein
MSILTRAIYDVLAGDATLAGLLATYNGLPAVFTSDPAPGDAEPPYIVTAGDVAQTPFDTKTTRGREMVRDVRCYDNAGGGPVVIEAIAERARYLLHRRALAIAGHTWILSECGGPTVADEPKYYGRILTIRAIAQEV